MRRYVFALLTAALILVTGCIRDEPTATPSATEVVNETSTPRPTREVQRIEVRVENGEVEGGAQRYNVKLGSRVELTVHSDVTDEVHVHGIDESADVMAGSLVSIGFVADAPGIFVVELEERKIELLELAVR
ncbi:MAG: hypothetical protein WD826_10595 [Actinomycetota bacterium]